MGLSMLEVIETAGRAFGVPIAAAHRHPHRRALSPACSAPTNSSIDVWGDTVNTAKRMESYGLPGRVHVSAATRHALGDAFRFEPRGALDIKGKGLMETYFLYRQ